MENDMQNNNTLYSYYELGFWTMQLVIQKYMKTSGNKDYEKFSFDDTIDFFLKRVNDKMLSMQLNYSINYDSVSLEIMDEVSENLDEPQKEYKQSAFSLGKEVIFWHSLCIATYNTENFAAVNRAKNVIFVCLKTLNINDNDILNCLEFEKSDYRSFEYFNERVKVKVDYFNMLIKMYLNTITLYPKLINTSKSTKFEYDVALSFAGEDREYVDIIANKLRSKGVKVFYDKFETSKLWGKDLYQYLSHIYKDKASYCVVFISLFYKNKVWTRHELRNAQNRAFLDNKEYILPIFLEDTELEGLNNTIGYIKASDFTDEEIVNLIIEKIEQDRS